MVEELVTFATYLQRDEHLVHKVRQHVDNHDYFFFLSILYVMSSNGYPASCFDVEVLAVAAVAAVVVFVFVIVIVVFSFFML